MAKYDLLIRGGELIDGLGGPRRRADVAVKDGRIAAIGSELEADATETLDATGLLVTPGFVDIHTHYDGQVSWDADFLPSAWHGVTTAVMGNCGVGFAPVRPADRQRLIELMEGVEDIPGSALAEGIDFRWESFAEYMEAVDFPHTMDFVMQVPHDALRVYVMGDRAVAGEPATEADIAEMRRLLREALEAGAAGFSTGRSDNHKSKQGESTPAAESEGRELAGIARAFAGLDHGVLSAVSDFDMMISPERFDAEFDVLEGMAEAADGHRLSLSCMQRDHEPKQWERILARVEAADARGVPMRVQVAPRGIGVMLGLEATFHPFMGFASYKAISQLPLAERVARMRDPETKARMLTESSEKVSGDGSPIPPIADFFLANVDMVAMRLYRLGENPNYEPSVGACLMNEAMSSGRRVLDIIYGALLEQDGHAPLYFPIYNYTGMNLDNVGKMLRHPLALPGLSDGGAHVGTVCDASFPTYLLLHWGRDRAEGKLPLERLVQMQTHDTATHVGLTDRGSVELGKRADLNVIDFPGLRLLPPGMQADLPAGGHRLVQRAQGYRATFVAGVKVSEDGELTGARPGRLARLPRPAA